MLKSLNRAGKAFAHMITKNRPSTSQHSISAEKAADLEFNFVSGEMRARTEFNRRVQNVQVTLLTSIFVAPLVAILTAKNQIDIKEFLNGGYAVLVSAAILGVITVNFIIYLEVEQNHTYIFMVAGYFDIILTRKYLIEGVWPAFDYSFWVNYQSRTAKSLIERNVFSLSAHVFLALSILFFAGIAFMEHQLNSTIDLRYRAPLITYFVFCVLLYTAFIYRQSKTVNRLRAFISSEEIEQFERRYPILKAYNRHDV